MAPTLQSLPILTLAAITAPAPITVPAPISTLGPITANGSTITGCEVAIDNLGNPQATVANVQTLGTAALPWLNVFSLYHDLTPTTTTQLAALVAPVGSIVLIEESVGGVLVANTYNLCVSTKAAAGDFTYIAVSTSIPAVVGAKCSN